MKRIFLFFAAAVVAVAAGAQTLNVETGNVTYAVPAAGAGDMVYTDGTGMTILGKTFATDEITRMYIDDSEVDDNTVAVSYDETGAKVLVAGNIAQYVTPTVSGAHVTIVQAETVGENTCGEITYTLAGTSDDGEFTLEGSYKATLELLGLTLTNPTGAPINIQNGKRIEMSVKSGTQNTLTDGADGSQKGCIVCKGHLELKGKGTLDVYGNKSHGIYSNEYVSMKNCTINVLASVKDGLNCNQYFLMESGVLNISGNGDDAIQVSFKDDADREEEDTGSITINGGTINASTSAKATKALKADGDILIKGGELTLSTSGGGTWDSEAAETKASSCISADGAVQIDGGTLVLTSTGGGGKGISCDGILTVNEGNITINTSGGTYA
ncbi:MAG: carbohydrate-binding domain-containing protein, partial [Prevotella sp.]